jgi:hypothetical protein
MKTAGQVPAVFAFFSRITRRIVLKFATKADTKLSMLAFCWRIPMRLTKTLIAAAVATSFAGAALAGGFQDTIEEVVVVAPAAPAGSLPGWVIPAVLVAGLVALAASGEGS